MSATITDGFGPGDDTKVVSILKKWRGGPLSNQLFTVLAGMLPQPSVVAVILRRRRNLEVLLVPRPSDDIVWPGMLNLPGQQFRVADFHREDGNPLNGPWERIQNNELKAKFTDKPEFSGISLHLDDRGPQIVFVYLIRIKPASDFSPSGEWVEVEKLKEMKNFIQSELKSIAVALDFYTAGSYHLPCL